MKRQWKIVVNGLLAIFVMLTLVTCTSYSHWMGMNGNNSQNTTSSDSISFRSNGERIYFTATSDRSTPITYTGDPAWNGGMMGNRSSGRMMNGGSSREMGKNGNLTCASCHGIDGRGGVHTMMGMQTMKSPDIRWSVLKSEFDAEKFRLPVTKGQDPDGIKQLNLDMPRWNIGNEDLGDLIIYLKTLS